MSLSSHFLLPCACVTISIICIASITFFTLTTASRNNDDNIWTEIDSQIPPYGNFWYGGSPQGVAAIPGNPSELVFAGKHILRRASVSVSPTTGKVNYTSLVYNDKAVPKFLAEKGYEHLGDSCVTPHQIVVSPFERQPSYMDPAIALHDLETLRFINYTVLPNQHHCPWTAYEPKTNSILSSEYDNVTEINVYSFPQLGSRSFKIKLTPPDNNPSALGANGLMHVQGGVVKNDTLYLTTDQRANPNTGYDLFAFNLTGIENSISGSSNQTFFVAKMLYGQNVLVEKIKGLYSEIEGVTIDDKNRMWIVTNVLDVAPYTLVLEKRNPRDSVIKS